MTRPVDSFCPASVRDRQAIRDLDALAWAPRRLDTAPPVDPKFVRGVRNASLIMAAAVILILLPVCFSVWMGWL